MCEAPFQCRAACALAPGCARVPSWVRLGLHGLSHALSFLYPSSDLLRSEKEWRGTVNDLTGARL